MPRIRTVKPELVKHEGMFDAETETGLPLRFAWVALFTVVDREGRFQWRPRALKADILPFDDLDFNKVLEAWLFRGFIVRYRVNDAWFGMIPTFKRHQNINPRESASGLPGIEDADEIEEYKKQTVTSNLQEPSESENGKVVTRQLYAVARNWGKEGKGKEGKGKEGKEGGLIEEPLAVAVTITTNNGDEFPITENQIAEWQITYPAVDVRQHLNRMKTWSNANPRNRKTRGGMLRFVNSWLAKEQDRTNAKRKTDCGTGARGAMARIRAANGFGDYGVTIDGEAH